MQVKNWNRAAVERLLPFSLPWIPERGFGGLLWKEFIHTSVHLFVAITFLELLITDTETVRHLNSLYNYQVREKENNQLKAENEKKQILIIYIFSIGLLTLSLSFAYLQYNRRKRLQLSIQLKQLQQLQKEQYKKSALFIEENKRNIKELKYKLQQADQTNKVWHLYLVYIKF